MRAQCTIPKCLRIAHGNGYCYAHWRRDKRYGNPLKGSPNKNKIVHWLKKHCTYDSDECLIWPFSTLAGGYGQCTNYFGVGKGAHRNMCYMAHGKPPTLRYEAAHSCRHRACVNPRHLSWKTAKANRMDKVRDDTHLRGERNHKAKITATDVHFIRKMRGKMTGRTLAERFDVTPALISRIYKGKCWAWLE